MNFGTTLDVYIFAYDSGTAFPKQGTGKMKHHLCLFVCFQFSQGRYVVSVIPDAEKMS